MSPPFRIARVLSGLIAPLPPLHRALRSVYHALWYRSAVRTAVTGGITARFRTPTPTIAEQVESLTGEAALLRDLLGAIREGDVVWDAGAGFGLYAVFAARRLRSTGAVIAFEPEPRLAALLERNIAENALTGVEVLRAALGAHDGAARLFAAASANPGTSSDRPRTDYPLLQRPLTVPQHRGDTIVAGGVVPPPTILKLDVEGAEGSVLDGMVHTLRAFDLRRVYCEAHPSLLAARGDSVERIEHRLVQAGLRLRTRAARGTEVHLVFSRES